MRSRFFYIVLGIGLLLAKQADAQIFEQESIAKQELEYHLKKPLAKPRSFTANYHVHHYNLNLLLNPDTQYVQGSNAVSLKVLSNASSLEIDLSSKLIVDSLFSSKGKEKYIHLADVIYINLASSLPKGSSETITIYYHGRPSGTGFGSFGIGKNKTGKMLWTLSQPYGASDWWPCKNTLNDKADSLDVSVTTGKTYNVASNGLLVDSSTQDTFITRHWRHRYTIAAYLVAVAVGQYDIYSNWAHLKNDSVEILNYVFPESLQSAITNTKDVVSFIELFSKLFIDYPFKKEKYGHAEFGWGGGMEHQTMSFMGKFNWDLEAHELAHQWFGDWVTCGSWQDIWLNEAFATYLNGLTYEFLKTQQDFTNWKAQVSDGVMLLPDGSVLCKDTSNAYKIFDSRLVYSKGAMVLHMLRQTLGDSLFFLACRNHLNNRGGNYAVTTNFIDECEKTTGKKLDTFFSEWYYGEGFPIFNILWERLPSGELSIDIEQNPSSSTVSFFHIPVELQCKNGVQFYDFKLYPQQNKEHFTLKPPFDADTIIYNPYYNWLGSATLKNTTNLTGKGEVLLLFPNPAKDKLQIKLLYPNTIKSIYITDNHGKLVMDWSTTGNPSNFYEADISTFSSGEYIITAVNQNGQRFSEKFVVL
ncbi:MAG: M1 family aminopeptidase [Bacteroidota bacterium]|nr:M1 family aminopeptidase [Bacteroidota bacterium]